MTTIKDLIEEYKERAENMTASEIILKGHGIPYSNGYSEGYIQAYNEIIQDLESLRSSQEDVIEKKRKCDWNEEKHGHPCPYCEKGR